MNNHNWLNGVLSDVIIYCDDNGFQCTMDLLVAAAQIQKTKTDYEGNRGSLVDFLQSEYNRPIKEGATSLTFLNHYGFCQKIHDPSTGLVTVFFPYAAVILENPQDKIKCLIFIEVDLGTEELHIIQEKIAAYHLYAKKGLYSKHGYFDQFVVLFQAESLNRAKNMVGLINEMQCQPAMLVTDHQQVISETILKSEILLTQ